MEPLEGIEPSAYALPRRRYTTKPQWRLKVAILLLVINLSNKTMKICIEKLPKSILNLDNLTRDHMIFLISLRGMLPFILCKTTRLIARRGTSTLIPLRLIVKGDKVV